MKALSKRILLLTPSMSKGGAETQLLKLAIFLQSEGNQVLIISLKPIDEFKGLLEASGLEVLFLKDWSAHFISNLRLFYRRFREFKPELVIAFMFVAIIFARLLKLKFKFKLISSIRISVLPAKWYLPFKITNRLDDVVVYNSAASKRNFESQYPSLKRGTVIHNGIAVPELSTAQRSVNGVFKWICVGHFRWNKDYPTLFKAIALIREHNFMVNILGETGGADWPAQMIAELHIENRVNLIGFQPDTAAYLDQSDAFVLSSFSEGMPNAVLEAMAHALPVVLTDIDGNNELLSTVACGFLTEKENEYDLATKMLRVMDSTEKERNAFGTLGRAYIKAWFSEAQVMKRWKQLIEEMED